MSYEETLINKIRGAINALRTNRKTAKQIADEKIPSLFPRLKEINEPMAQELMQDYKAACANLMNSSK